MATAAGAPLEAAPADSAPAAPVDSAPTPDPSVGGEAASSAAGKKASKKAEKKAAKKAANSAGGAEQSGRKGPSGQALKGPEQQTKVVEVPPPVSENVLVTPPIEAENVHKVYDTIAEHWNHTRYKPWPRVESFIRSLSPGSLVADLGCGNGKNLPAVLEARCFPVASDICAPLARIAAEHGADMLVDDCLNTCFRGGIYDAVLSIAVLHHLSSVPRRVQVFREAARLLRPGGQFLVYCWSYEQDANLSRSRHRFAGQDVLVPWSHRLPGVKKPKEPPQGGGAADGGGAAAAGDESTAAEAGGAAEAAEAQWEPEAEVQQRYCHVYREGELPELLAQVPELEVVECYFDTGNWCAISRRREEE